MARRRDFVHVGLPKAASTSLQAALAALRETPAPAAAFAPDPRTVEAGRRVAALLGPVPRTKPGSSGSLRDRRADDAGLSNADLGARLKG